MKGEFFDFIFLMYCIQHCFICRPSESTVSEDAGIEPRTFANFVIGSHSNHSDRSHHTRLELDLIPKEKFKWFLSNPDLCRDTNGKPIRGGGGQHEKDLN